MRCAVAQPGGHSCAQSIAALGALQLVQGCGHQPGAAHAQGVADCDGAAVWIDVFGIIGQTKQAHAGQ